ncbi:MAG TPA: 16S rRNA (guanine(966)-N(2))-methyltransferase RsmD [bacterium]|nr:16S rRNA (guanine(966)-N(2))-methyltransferase RsmD [bacterium]HQG44286.1 16S rRNA (guanine(966)-N(2))-methyltransferase RsmD [bacterium]HQI47676.1 16S rRNA (guanine(966)-N(2))-methyltransferase RsmD [bacterium]HQJ63359.1 16S rRNA (guanine(966)-N(2))-methyltransferase RsmD [bacterium]
MRVIAGRFRNRSIQSLKAAWLRPTTDRTREFIFSWLGNLVPEARVLDLFAGTGSLGIEAVSRGAVEATFVDSAAAAYTLIQRNTAALDIPAAVFRQEALSYLKRAARMHWRYDLIFCDPPYFYPEYAELLQQIQEGAVLQAEGLLIYEASSREMLACPEPWRLRKEKVMGDTRILFMELEHAEENSDLSRIV